MSIATTIDHADARRRADALCCSLAFGDGDPAPVVRQARAAMAEVRRGYRHAESLRVADALCCRLAFGDGDPAPVMREAREAVADVRRGRRDQRGSRILRHS